MRRVFGSLILCIMLFLVGCSQENYEPATFDKNDVWSIKLKAYQKTADSITLNMQESIFNKVQADKALNLTKDALKKIKRFNKLANNNIEVYILDDAFFDNSIYIGGNKIYCTYDSIESNEYMEQLVRAAYNLTEPAIIYGLTGYIFGDDVDIKNLKNYYLKADDISILGLFGARFYEEWNTVEEIKIAKDTAISLVNYCVENNKKDLVISQNIDNDLKQQWLNSIGVNRTYENAYDLDFNVFTFDKSNQYSLVIDSDEAKYNMFKFEYLDNSKDVEKFIYKDIKGRKEILEYLEHNAPKSFKNIDINTKPIYSYMEGSGIFRGLSKANGKIELFNNTTINLHLHEYAHLLSDNEYNKPWLAEGLAEYLSIAIYKDNYTIEAWTTDFGTSDNESYVGIAENYYLNNIRNITHENLDGRLLLDARAYAAKRYYNDKGNIKENGFSKPLYEIYNLHDTIEGRELNYYEAASFTAYLIDKYSLDKYLSYYIGDLKNSTFEDAFGTSYSDAKKDWISYVGL